MQKTVLVLFAVFCHTLSYCVKFIYLLDEGAVVCGEPGIIFIYKRCV